MQEQKSTFSKTIEEIEATWQGRPVLVDVKVEVAGTVWPGYAATHWEPGNGPSVDFGRETFSAVAVADAETGDRLVLTADLVVFAQAQGAAFVEAHRADLEMEWLQQEADADEAAVDTAIDRAIDERRERGL